MYVTFLGCIWGSSTKSFPLTKLTKAFCFWERGQSRASSSVRGTHLKKSVFHQYFTFTRKTPYLSGWHGCLASTTTQSLPGKLRMLSLGSRLLQYSFLRYRCPTYVSASTSLMDSQLVIQHMHCHPPAGVSKSHAMLPRTFSPSLIILWSVASGITRIQNWISLEILMICLNCLNREYTENCLELNVPKPLMAFTPGVEIGGLKGTFPILVYTHWYWLKICQQVCLSFVI